MLVQTLDGVEDGDALALRIRAVLRHAHHAVLNQELGRVFATVTLLSSKTSAYFQKL